MKSTKFWLLLLAVLLAASAAGSLLLFMGREGSVANVYLDGRLLRSIDLDAAQSFSFDVDGPIGSNTVQVEHGRIRVSHADCPDQVCVRQGWVSDSAAPIVCLPNGLVIRIEGGAQDGIDGAAG